MGLLDLLFNGNQTSSTEQQTPTVQQYGAVPVKTIEVGSTGTEIYAGYLDEDYLAELNGKVWMEKIDMIRRSDANVKMCTNALKSPLKSANWIIKTREESEMAEKQKLLIEKALFQDINKSFTRLIGEILTFVDYGYSLFDITHQVKTDKELGTYNTLKSISYRSQKTIERWNVLPDGTLKTVTQIAYGDLGVMTDMDARFLLHFAPDQEGDNFEGVSVIRSMYGCWLRKNKFLQLTAAGIEKYAIPTPVGTVPVGTEGKAEFAAFKRALECYSSNQTNYIILPEGFKIEFNNVTFDAEMVRSAINAENQEMVNSILASFLLLGQNGAGSLALSNNLSNFFAQTITYLSDHIIEQIDRKIISQLIKMNMGDVPVLVELWSDNLEDQIDVSWVNMLTQLKAQGLISADSKLENDLREKLKLEEKELEPEKSIAGQVAISPSGEKIQDQVLNGAQIASLIEIVQSVASETLPRDSALNIIETAFQVDKEKANELLGSAGNGFKIEQKPIEATLSEKKKSKEKIPNVIRNTKSLFQTTGVNYLTQFANKYINSIMIQKGKTSDGMAIKAPVNATVPSISKYQSVMDAIAYIATIETADIIEPRFDKTLAEFNLATTKIKKVENAIDRLLKAMKAVEDASPMDKDDALDNLFSVSSSVSAILEGYLTPEQKRIIKAKNQVFTDTQKNDVIKSVDLSYQTALDSMTDDELDFWMKEQANKTITGAITTTGSDIQASQTVNNAIDQAAQEYTERTGDEILSYTFVAVDDDVTTDICRELDGKTFSPDDPELEKHRPPLHWNCRSYLSVNTTKTGSPEITGLPPLSKKAQKQLVFKEKVKKKKVSKLT